MNRILYYDYSNDDIRCKCQEDISITKKRKPTNRTEGKPLVYPKSNELISKTFQIKYEKQLSSVAKCLLNSFQHKYFYYAVDDILYLCQSNPKERENLLAILYSPVISLQNNLFINFFDIWIQEIYITEVFKSNKFLKPTNSNLESFHSITIKLLYRAKTPLKQQESLW